MRKFLPAVCVIALLMQSTPSLSQWVATPGITNGNIYTFGTSSTNLFAGTGSITSVQGMYRFDPVTSSWILASSGLPNGDIAAIAKHGDNLFAGVSGVGLYRSSNEGETWHSAIPEQMPLLYQAVLGHGSYLYFAAYGGGVHTSTDNGSTWKDVSLGLPNKGAYSLAASGASVFAGLDGGQVYMTSDNGVTWTNTCAGLPKTQIRSLTVSGSGLFAGTENAGVYYSSDNGITWTEKNSGLDNLGIRQVVVTPSALFAATKGGVYMSRDAGESWFSVSEGLTNKFTLGLVAFDGFLYSSNGSFTSFRRPLEDFDALGVKESVSAGVSVWPNPVSDVMNVRNAIGQLSEITILNMLGQPMTKVSLSSDAVSIDVSSLPIGTYVVRVAANGKTTTSKVVKALP